MKLKTLAEITKRLNRASTVIPVPMIWLNPELNIAGFNQAFLDIADAGKSNILVGMTLTQCFPELVAEKMIAQFRSVIESGQTQIDTEEFKDPVIGKARHFMSIRAPLFGRDRKLVGVIGVSVELPQSMVTNSKQEALTVLAQKMAHDIQSPLTAMLIMLKHCDELVDAKKTILNSALNSIKAMTDNLLVNYRANASKAIQHEEKKPILCADFLTKLVRERQYQYQNSPVRFDLRIESRAEYAFVVAQQSQLTRAVSNVIANAVDALNKLADACVNIHLDADQHQVVLSIEDNGKGMPEYMIHKLLNRTSFTEGKQHGHGIGLTQVWDMVDFNQAELSIRSELGCGTVFSFTFKRAQNAEWLTDKFKISQYDTYVERKKPGEVDQQFSPYVVERIKTAELTACPG